MLRAVAPQRKNVSLGSILIIGDVDKFFYGFCESAFRTFVSVERINVALHFSQGRDVYPFGEAELLDEGKPVQLVMYALEPVEYGIAYIFPFILQNICLHDMLIGGLRKFSPARFASGLDMVDACIFVRPMPGHLKNRRSVPCTGNAILVHSP